MWVCVWDQQSVDFVMVYYQMWIVVYTNGSVFQCYRCLTKKLKLKWKCSETRKGIRSEEHLYTVYREWIMI